MDAARRVFLQAGLALAAGLGAGAACAGDEPSIEAQSRAIEHAAASVVAVHAVAVEGARSVSTLGRARTGSGVVIGGDGLVLTIGYLVLEAEQIEVVTDDARHLPARLVGYDVATGFGLVQALAPLKRPPVALGSSGAVRDDEPLFIVSGGEDGAVSGARMVSRRAFSGYWEYHVDGALFTTPPRADHSGAALVNRRGELLGIGSLLVRDALGPGAGMLPGNMFVPVDLLKPILGELRERGASRASTRAWLGVSCVEQEGEVRVVRVADDSPADVAGLEPGDRIVRIDGAAVDGLATLWKRLWDGGRPEREVTLDIERKGQAQTVKVQSVDRAKTLKRPVGV